jgi:hypothetical protein
MPVARYFFFVGGALLALLFVVNAALPALPVAESPQSAGTDHSIIRIHSDKKWPERIVFDTTRPTIVPNPTLAAARIAEAPQPPKVAAIEPAKGQAREAFAELRANANELRTAPRRKYKAVARSLARNYVGPPPINYGAPRPFVVAQQPRFGFFGNNVW